MAACLWFDGIYQPQSIDRLQCFFCLQLLKRYLLLIIRSQGGQKGIAFNMAQPHGLPINIPNLLFLPLVVYLQHYLSLVVQTYQGLLFTSILTFP